jgi:hypothetical protein
MGTVGLSMAVISFPSLALHLRNRALPTQHHKPGALCNYGREHAHAVEREVVHQLMSKNPTSWCESNLRSSAIAETALQNIQRDELNAFFVTLWSV